MAYKLHLDYKNVKPYTIFCKELFTKNKVKFLNFEINLLEDSLIPNLLSEFILQKKDIFLQLNNKAVKVKLNVSVPQKWLNPYISLTTIDDIKTKVVINFISPTTFRRNDIDLPFPLPGLLFKGLIKKWLAFSEIPIEVDLRKYYNLIEIERYNLKTYKVNFSNGGKLIAFKGFTVFNFYGVENKKAIKWFNILLKFSNWSGIGRKTTMGLGKIYLKET